MKSTKAYSRATGESREPIQRNWTERSSADESTSTQALGFRHAAPGELESYTMSSKMRPSGVHEQIHVFRYNQLGKACIENCVVSIHTPTCNEASSNMLYTYKTKSIVQAQSIDL